MAWFRKKVKTREKALQSPDDRSWTRIFDWVRGAWQTHDPLNTEDSVLSNPTVFSCQTLIAGDIAKIKASIQEDKAGIWYPVPHPFNKLLKRPNDYQNQIQFKEAWVLSKLSFGNTYVLKVRDGSEVVQLHVLDPLKVTPLVADNGDVFYRINEERLAKVEEGQTVVPATEIIHDRFNCFYHPLVGLSPIFAAAISAQMGNTVQNNLKAFFANGSNPGGLLSAPGPISDSTAKRLKEYWEANFTGTKSGSLAVAGDGIKFENLRMNNVDAQVLELLGWSDAKICSTYHVPGYLVGVGDLPSYNNIDSLITGYYSQCLQILFESMEACLDAGLGLEEKYRVQNDINAGLFRMDMETLVKTLGDGVSKALMSPDEGRKVLNLPSVPGGKYPYLQQQNYSLEALAKRDAENPLVAPPAPIAPAQQDVQNALDLFDAIVKDKSLI